MSDQTPFNIYFKELHAVAHQGDAREESFYPALAAMLKAAADGAGREDVSVTTQPRPTDAGNPDFRLSNGADRLIAYVEAKRPDLDLAAGRLVAVGFAFSCQVCIAVQRVIVHDAVYETFVPDLVRRVAALKVGDPLEPDTDGSALITKDDHERVREWYGGESPAHTNHIAERGFAWAGTIGEDGVSTAVFGVRWFHASIFHQIKRVLPEPDLKAYTFPDPVPLVDVPALATWCSGAAAFSKGSKRPRSAWAGRRARARSCSGSRCNA